MNNLSHVEKPTNREEHYKVYEHIVEQFAHISTSTIGHLNDQGYLPDIKAVYPCHKTVSGFVFTVTLTSDNTDVIRQALLESQPGDVLCIDARTLGERACWGALRTCAAIYEKLSAVIVLGKVTDSSELQKLGFPVFARGVSALTTFKSDAQSGELHSTITYGSDQSNGVTASIINSGDIAILDNDGVFVLSPKRAQEILADCQKKQQTDEAKFNFFLMAHKKHVEEGTLSN